jgi:hypothetical protein
MDTNAGDSLLTEPAPSAGDQVKSELADIMSNPQNQMHEGFKRNDPVVNAHIDKLYRKCYGTAPAIEDPGVTISIPLSQEALEAKEASEAQSRLRRELGESYEATMTDMRVGANHLFGGPDGQQLLTVFTEKLSGLGSKGEALGYRYLAELSKLIGA